METTVPQIDPAKLRAARVKADITQEQMGRVLCVSHSQIGNIEKGISDLNSNDLALWARETGVKNLHDFYTDAPPNHFRRRKKVSEKSPKKLSNGF